jgi:hypothetical protein
MLRLQPTNHIGLLVEKDGGKYVAYWVEYDTKRRRRTHITVLKCVATLLPRDGVGLAPADSAYDVPRADVRTWLQAAGYQIVAETA